MLKFLLVAIALGVLVYLTVRVIQRRGIAPRPSRPAPPPRRSTAPDDDADFLRDLERRRREQERRDRERDQGDSSG